MMKLKVSKNGRKISCIVENFIDIIVKSLDKEYSVDIHTTLDDLILKTLV